jgi:hypothetical protein
MHEALEHLVVHLSGAELAVERWRLGRPSRRLLTEGVADRRTWRAWLVG